LILKATQPALQDTTVQPVKAVIITPNHGPANMAKLILIPVQIAKQLTHKSVK